MATRGHEDDDAAVARKEGEGGDERAEHESESESESETTCFGTKHHVAGGAPATPRKLMARD